MADGWGRYGARSGLEETHPSTPPWQAEPTEGLRRCDDGDNEKWESCGGPGSTMRAQKLSLGGIHTGTAASLRCPWAKIKAVRALLRMRCWRSGAKALSVVVKVVKRRECRVVIAAAFWRRAARVPCSNCCCVLAQSGASACNRWFARRTVCAVGVSTEGAAARWSLGGRGSLLSECRRGEGECREGGGQSVGKMHGARSVRCVADGASSWACVQHRKKPGQRWWNHKLRPCRAVCHDWWEWGVWPMGEERACIR